MSLGIHSEVDEQRSEVGLLLEITFPHTVPIDRARLTT